MENKKTIMAMCLGVCMFILIGLIVALMALYMLELIDLLPVATYIIGMILMFFLWEITDRLS